MGFFTMSEMLQINTPVMPKNYNVATKPIVQNDEIFDLVDLSKVVKSSDRSDQNTQHDAAFNESSGVIPKLPMLISKDPSLTAASLKTLLSNDTISQLTQNGNTELLNKLAELAKEILLNPSSLLADLKAQQQSSTLFNGDFFNLLRSISAQTTNPDIKNAILNILKATVNASTGQDILNSLSINLKFLGEQLSASKNLSQTLQDLSKQLSSPSANENFPQIKAQVLNALHDVGLSLLLTDKTMNVIPLVTYNLSRYSDNAAALKDSFNGLVDLLSNKDLKSALSKAFGDFIENSNLPSDVKNSALSAYGVSKSENVAVDSYMESLVKELATSANLNGDKVDVMALKGALSKLSSENGVSSLKDILMQVLPESSEALLNKLLLNFNENKDLNSLLGKLSTILNSIDSLEVKIPLAQKLNEALGKLAKSENISYTPPSSMENLADFLAKNINDAALKSLNTLNQNEMVQSLLTAPGVFTPLLHYLVPLEIEDTRAFGELWVDNDAGGSSDEDNQNHFFLSFTVENIGDFELEIYTKNTDMNIALMCPPELTKSFSKMKDSIARIAASSGFTPKSTVIDALNKKRNLIEVFSRIKEKRVGLNVTA